MEILRYITTTELLFFNITPLPHQLLLPGREVAINTPLPLPHQRLLGRGRGRGRAVRVGVRVGVGVGSGVEFGAGVGGELGAGRVGPQAVRQFHAADVDAPDGDDLGIQHLIFLMKDIKGGLGAFPTSKPSRAREESLWELGGRVEGG